LAGSGLYNIYQLNTVNSAAADIRDNWMPASKALGEIKFLITRYRLYALRQIQTTDPAQLTSIKEKTSTLLAELGEATKRYLALMTGPEEQKIWDDYAKLWNGYLPEHAKMLEQAEKGDKAGAAQLFNDSTLRLFDQVLGALDIDITFQDKGSDTAGELAQATYAHAIGVTGIALALALLFCAGAAIWTVKDLIAPINGITRAMKQLADGDLAANIPYVRRTDEIGCMAGTLEVFKDSLAAKRAADQAAAADAQARLERTQRRARLTESPLGKCHVIVIDASNRVIEEKSMAAAETWSRVS
jgi:methyl-accepting chemotaxis protein